MKKLLVGLTLLIGLLVPLTFVSEASAVNVFGFCSGNNAGNASVCKDTKSQKAGDNPVIDLIKTAIQIFAAVLGVVSIIVVIVSGMRFINSGGDAQKVAGARSGLIYALVGIVIAALAQTIVSLVLTNA